MGANAATKLFRVLDNVISVAAMEWLTAAQAYDFRADWNLSTAVDSVYQQLRSEVTFMATDRYLHEDIICARTLLVKSLS
jgi:histidine ammonia-lyase